MPTDRQLLNSIRREIARLATLELPNARYYLHLHLAVVRARHGIVAIDWFAFGVGLSSAERRAGLRALDRLEAAGLIEREYLGYDGRRATHIRVIEAKP
jgi:hypothetical protein